MFFLLRYGRTRQRLFTKYKWNGSSFWWDNALFLRYFETQVVCFSHVWNPAWDRTFQLKEHLHLTYTVKDQTGWGREVAECEAPTRWGDERTATRAPRIASTWATALWRCCWVPNLISLAGDLSLSRKRLLETERIKKNNIVKKWGCWACTLLAGIPLSFLRAPQISFILGQ